MQQEPEQAMGVGSTPIMSLSPPKNGAEISNPPHELPCSCSRPHQVIVWFFFLNLAIILKHILKQHFLLQRWVNEINLELSYEVGRWNSNKDSRPKPWEPTGSLDVSRTSAVRLFPLAFSYYHAIFSWIFLLLSPSLPIHQTTPDYLVFIYSQFEAGIFC